MPSRNVSPATPLSPLEPSLLPQWLRQSRPRRSRRLKITLIALGCITLGWMVISALGPADDTVGAVDSVGIYEIPKDPEEPSVKSALSDLHHAMSDKLQSWNPYKNKPLPASVLPVHTSTSLNGEEVYEGNSEGEKLGARTRVGKCTMLINVSSYYERALRTHEIHDRQHGYRLHVLRQGVMDGTWSKPLYVLCLLLRELAKPESDRLEWLVWFDADTIILNPNVPLELFLPPPGPEFSDVHLLYTNDINGLNSGVFPVRVSQWAVELFSAITSYRHYRPDEELEFGEQSALSILIQDPKFAPHVVETPQRWFNAYFGEHDETLSPYQVRRGDMLVHFAGVPNRDERMGHWLERAEQHLDDWEIPLKATSYPQEVKDFWNSQRDLRKIQKEGSVATRLLATQLLTKTEDSMNEYGDLLAEDQKNMLNEKKDELRQIIENEEKSRNLAKVEEAIKELENASQPLTIVISGSHKLILQSAHEAIFAGVKDLLDAGFSHGVTSLELEQVSQLVRYLKSAVMVPEDQWDKDSIQAATNALTEARARLPPRSEVQAASTPATADEAGKAKALEEAKTLLEEQAAMESLLAAFTASSAIVTEAVAPAATEGETMPAEPPILWVTVTEAHDSMPTIVVPGE